MKGKIYLEEDWTKKTYFVGIDEPIVTTASANLTKLRVAIKPDMLTPFHLIAAAAGS